MWRIVFRTALAVNFGGNALAWQVAAPSWGELYAKNPAAVRFELRLPRTGMFRQGELIRLDATLPQNHYRIGTALPSPPPESRWDFAGFLLDPPAKDCGTPDRPCAGGSGMMPNGRMVHDDPGIVLNEYVPVLPRGRYRVAGLLRKLVMQSHEQGSVSYTWAMPPQYVVSNAVEVQIEAADPAWVSEQLRRDVSTLRDSSEQSPEAYKAKRAAADRLRLLDVPDSWRASLDLLPIEEGPLLSGLARTGEPAKVCALLQERIPALEQSVSLHYFQTISQTCARAHLPDPPMPKGGARPMAVARISAVPPPQWAVPADRDPEMEGYFAKRQAYDAELMAKASAALAGSLGQKQAEPKLTAFGTLLTVLQQRQASSPSETAPSWTPVLIREFVRAYPSMEVSRRTHLLSMFATTAPADAVAPLLELTLEEWKPGDPFETVHTAIRAFESVDAAGARERMLAELSKPKTWLDVHLLELLPTDAVPPMDDKLIEALAAAQKEGGWNPQLRMAALAKYGSAEALPRVKAIFESQTDACQPELLAYFVRVDPEYADSILRRQPVNLHTPPHRCTMQYFERTPPLAMSKPLEKFIAAHLMHGVVFVKMMAARSLGRYGSPAAQEPLWETYRYFHNYWKGKQDTLEQNGEGVVLEVELRNALARGGNWLMGESELRTIESLCISNQCRQETQGDLRVWQSMPLQVMIYDGPMGLQGSVGHYIGLQGLPVMRAKLAQFPRGTTFALHVHGAGARRAGESLKKAASESGIELKPAAGR